MRDIFWKHFSPRPPFSFLKFCDRMDVEKSQSVYIKVESLYQKQKDDDSVPFIVIHRQKTICKFQAILNETATITREQLLVSFLFGHSEP